MKLSLIAAMSENNVIGINNKLPWHLPDDLAWFKLNTKNKTVVMGRKTWESLPIRPLPGRENIIITSNNKYVPKDSNNEDASSKVCVVSSVKNAIKTAKKNEVKELVFIGGASLYKQIINKADRMFLTIVKDNINGDAFFPKIDFLKWELVSVEHKLPGQKNNFAYSFNIFKKKL